CSSLGGVEPPLRLSKCSLVSRASFIFQHLFILMAGFHLQGILVKNTFVTIEDPSVDDASSCSSHRRSSSAPPLTSRHGMSNSLSGDCSPTCSISDRMDSSASTDIDDLTVCLQ
ncbi:unnamed protein product, partial [Polarella glacialis]